LENKNSITLDGLLEFSKDLEIEPDDISLLILFYKLDLKIPYIITKDEFIKGFEKLK
jgi:hypothetical protein